MGAVRDAELEPFAYDGPVDGTWQTLREMTDSGKRVVFLAENQAGAAPWYHLAYKAITEETPYAFRKVPQLNDPDKLPKSCEPNRGPEGAPLFLMNHWITTDPVPLPSNAAQGERLRQAARAREGMPSTSATTSRTWWR